jgi:molybdate transport system substrate-binding protein
MTTGRPSRAAGRSRTLVGVTVALTVAFAAAVVVVRTGVPTTGGAAGAAVPIAAERRTLTVSAATSLTEAFTRIGARFERRNPGVTVAFNFSPSSTLATQIQAGAPADVFAAADPASMDRLVAGGQVTTTPVSFARNRMAIAVKPGNPGRITGVADLATAGTVSLCGPSVPCGAYAAGVLRTAGVTIPEARITRGTDARTTLGAVARGDAVAAIVYATDIAAAGRAVEAVAIPAVGNVVAVYPIAPVAGGDRRLARSFVDVVTGPTGQRILAGLGFLPA